MSTPRTSLLTQLEKAGLGARMEEYVPVFDGTVDMFATARMHAEAFQGFISYMEEHLSQYIIQFEGSNAEWLLVEFLKFIYASDPNFRFRLYIFMKGMTEKYSRTEDAENLIGLGMGNIGTQFLAWEMVLALLVIEGSQKDKVKEKAKTKALAVTVEEATEDIEELDEAMEASMALMLIGDAATLEDEDMPLEGDEVLEEAPDLQIAALNAVIIDDRQFLFLDDISKTLGLREDESLSVLSIYAGMKDPHDVEKKETNFEIDFADESLNERLTYLPNKSEDTLMTTVANTLMEIHSAADFCESMLESSFVKHTPLFTTGKDDHSSIDLTKIKLQEKDDEIKTAYHVDKFAMHTGGVRGSSTGRDNSLWHYLPFLGPSILRVFHLDVSKQGCAELLKCKALSAIVSDDSLTSNANKCILVDREATMYAFTGKHSGSILTHCALNLAQGVNQPQEIVKSLGSSSAIKPLPMDIILRKKSSM